MEPLVFVVVLFALTAFYAMGFERGRSHPIDPQTLPARDRHPSRALPRRWE